MVYTVHKTTNVTPFQKHPQLDRTCLRTNYIMSVMLCNPKYCWLGNFTIWTTRTFAMCNYFNHFNYLFTIIFERKNRWKHVNVTIIITCEHAVPYTLYGCFIYFEPSRKKFNERFHTIKRANHRFCPLHQLLFGGSANKNPTQVNSLLVLDPFSCASWGEVAAARRSFILFAQKCPKIHNELVQWMRHRFFILNI